MVKYHDTACAVARIEAQTDQAVESNTHKHKLYHARRVVMLAIRVVHLLTLNSTVLPCMVDVFNTAMLLKMHDMYIYTWPGQLGSSYPGWLSGRRLPGLAQA